VNAILKVEADSFYSSRLNTTPLSRAGTIATILQHFAGYRSRSIRAAHYFARGNSLKASSEANTTGVSAATVVIV
jgi:hypothetical protein